MIARFFGGELVIEKHWIGIAFFLFHAVTIADADRSDPRLQNQPQIGIERGANNDYRLIAKRAPLRDILERIRQQTQTVLHYESLPDVHKTVVCRGTLEDLLQCVLGDANGLMIRHRGGESPNTPAAEEIWILESNGGDRADLPKAGVSSQCGEAHGASSGRQAASGSGSADALPDVERKRLVERIQSADLPARAEAMSRLAHEDDAEVLGSIQDGLSDEHPSIRAQAVAILAARGVEGKDLILRQALLDPVAGVRLSAVDNAGDDESLLLMALQDDDKNVRMLANLKLEELNRRFADRTDD